MTEPRTAHVNVLVTKSLPIDEPQWCTGHRDDRANFKSEITHSGPEETLTFRGETLWTLQPSPRLLAGWPNRRPCPCSLRACSPRTRCATGTGCGSSRTPSPGGGDAS